MKSDSVYKNAPETPNQSNINYVLTIDRYACPDEILTGPALAKQRIKANSN